MAKWNVLLHERIIKTFEIEEGQTVTIGRGKDADVNIDNVGLSRRQTALQLHQGRHLLTDLNSLNGTFVNGSKIEGTVQVSEEDRIEFAKFRLALVPTPTPMSPPFAPADFEVTMYVEPKAEAAGAGEPGPSMLSVIEGTASPALISLQGMRLIRIGRGLTCDIRVSGWRVGRIQCYIMVIKDKYHLRDKGWWWKTTVNGVKVHGEQELARGDVIGFGRTKLKLE